MSITASALRDRRRGMLLLRRHANARAVFDTGVEVDGLHERLATRPQLGGMQAAAREVTFECLTAELPEHVRSGSVLQIRMGDQLLAAPGAWRVQQAGRIDDLEDGVTLLLLERA
jgi:hypothetical protein